MPRNDEIRVKANNSNHNFASSHETATLHVWRAIAKVYKFFFFGLEEKVTVEDAKGYTKAALLLIAAVVLGGMVEGGAL